MVLLLKTCIAKSFEMTRNDLTVENGERHRHRMCDHQCWACYAKNVIYYSLLVTPFKSNIVTLLITVISYTTSYITFPSHHTEVVTVYLPHKCY